MPCELTDREMTTYDEQGYLVVRNLVARQVVERVFDEIKAAVDGRPHTPTELIQYEPYARQWPDSKRGELDVRKLFRMSKHVDFFRELSHDHRLLSIAKQLLGPQISLAQSMLLMKPPQVGGEKTWHQDNAYFRLDPPACFGYWIACDPARIENGCMHVVPGSHRQGVRPHAGEGDEYGLVDRPHEEEIVAIELEPGDGLLFHCELFHFTPANKTTHRRRAMQYHYMATTVKKTYNQFPWEPEIHFS